MSRIPQRKRVFAGKRRGPFVEGVKLPIQEVGHQSDEGLRKESGTRLRGLGGGKDSEEKPRRMNCAKSNGREHVQCREISLKGNSFRSHLGPPRLYNAEKSHSDEVLPKRNHCNSERDTGSSEKNGTRTRRREEVGEESNPLPFLLQTCSSHSFCPLPPPVTTWGREVGSFRH